MNNAGPHEMSATPGLIGFNGSRDNNNILSGQNAADQTNGALTNFDGYTVIRDDAGPCQWVDTKTTFIQQNVASCYNSAGSVPMHKEPFIVGDMLCIYVNFFAYTPMPRCQQGIRTIGLAKLRPYAFAGFPAITLNQIGLKDGEYRKLLK